MRCPECDGCGRIAAEVDHDSVDPARECVLCRGHGEVDVCGECHEEPADADFGPFICQACATSCPCCSYGTVRHGVPCADCLERDTEDAYVHERMHGPEVAS